MSEKMFTLKNAHKYTRKQALRGFSLIFKNLLLIHHYLASKYDGSKFTPITYLSINWIKYLFLIFINLSILFSYPNDNICLFTFLSGDLLHFLAFYERVLNG